MQRSAVLALALLASAVPAAAFDCAKASTEIEKAICADPAALAANDRMETVYFAMRDRLKGTPGEAILKDGQRAWLRHRDAFCNPEAECLASESDGRAQALAKTPEGAAPFMIWQAFKPGIYQVAISGPRFFDQSVPGAANLLSIHIYNSSFLTWNFGLGSAMSALLLLFLLLVTAGYLAFTSRKVKDV